MGTTKKHLIEITDLNVRLGSKLVLESLNLEVNAAEVVALIGPNGAGKTTLIRAASGVLPSVSGSIRVMDQDFLSLTPRKRASLLSVVPQARRLPEAYTVRQVVTLGRTPYLNWLGRPTEQDRQRIEWALDRTNLLDLADRHVNTLSGGEQQRVLLARSLAQETPLLLLDEPTAHLDLRYQAGLLSLVLELARQHNLGILMALHDLNLVSLYADRVALLAGGQIKAQGTPVEVLTQANLVEAYQVPLNVIPHPESGTPLVLPDGRGHQT